MYNKKRVEKKQDIVQIIVFLIIIIVIGIFLFKKPAVTGRVVESQEAIFSENLNLQVNESGSYEWQIKNPGSIKSLKASGSVSSNGTARVYIERNGARELIFDSTKQLFDIAIHVLPEYKKIFQGDEILLEIRLFNLRGFGSGNVNVKYSIKDSKENLIASEEETIFVETQAKFVRKLVMPAEIKPGTYVAFVEVLTDIIAGTGSDTFEVIAKYPYKPLELQYYLIGLAVLVAFVILIVISIQAFNVLKKKKEIAEIKAKMPKERVEKLEKELKALEEARKAGFISEESYKKDKERVEKELQKLRK